MMYIVMDRQARQGKGELKPDKFETAKTYIYNKHK